MSGTRKECRLQHGQDAASMGVTMGICKASLSFGKKKFGFLTASLPPRTWLPFVRSQFSS